jgi:hypothetical protein
MKTMAEIDLSIARSRVQCLRRHQLLNKVKSLLLPFTAHAGSIVTILAAWFMRSGSFKFRVNSISDWVVVGVLLLIGTSGSVVIFKALESPHRLIVKRSQLRDLVMLARADAEISVNNFGGDLSWLAEDLGGLIAIKQSKPTLQIRIYHDVEHFPEKIYEAIRQLNEEGIRFVPYPQPLSKFKWPFRFMLIDGEDHNSRRVYMYSRHKLPEVGESRDENRFVWQEFGHESPFTVQLAATLNGSIEASKRTPIKVGVSGVNNVGKTQLTARVSDLLRSTTALKVKIFPDEFRIAGGETNLQSNFFILISQLLHESSNDADVCIYDRTLVDNLCFLRLREKGNEQFYRILAPNIAEQARAFDLILDVRTDSRREYGSTTHVNGNDRKFVRHALDEFFATFGISTVAVKLNQDNFKQSLQDNTEIVVRRIVELYQLRGIKY